MAELRNCIQCGRVYAYQGNKLCSKCAEKVENDFSLVRKYLRAHPGASIHQVKEATGVDEKYILEFIRDGRVVAEGIGTVLNCERCGAAISEGRYCDRCLFDLNSELNSVLPSKEQVKPASAANRISEDAMYIKKRTR